MSVELDPAELGFRRPFQHEVAQVLKLRNPNRDPVAFKVKTTAPKQYCVRPNSGRIESGGEVEVQVLLQAMKEDPAPDAKCRDKFLVQSVAVTADREFSNVAQIWAHIEETAKSSIQEKKIRVVFLPADDSAGAVATTPARTNGLSEHDHTSPSPEAVTPARSVVAPVGSVSRPESRPDNAPHTGDARASATNPATVSSSISAAAASVTNTIPTSTEELKSQLAEAQAQIIRLKDQTTEGLRQRNVGGNKNITEAANAATAQIQRNAPASGVSLPITAALCLLSFLLAYFFF